MVAIINRDSFWSEWIEQNTLNDSVWRWHSVTFGMMIELSAVWNLVILLMLNILLFCRCWHFVRLGSHFERQLQFWSWMRIARDCDARHKGMIWLAWFSVTEPIFLLSVVIPCHFTLMRCICVNIGIIQDHYLFCLVNVFWNHVYNWLRPFHDFANNSTAHWHILLGQRCSLNVPFLMYNVCVNLGR